MIDDVLRDERERQSHVLVPVQRGFDIHVFNVGTSETGAPGADGAVLEEFGVDHVHCARSEFKRLVD